MTRALVLNASYEPLSVVSARRAVVLVIHGKAVAVADRDDEWRAETLSVKVPSVVKLTSFVNVPYVRTVPVTRRAVFGRDDYRCQYCPDVAESIDHVVPRSRGGQHVWENVVASCRRCNVRKGNRTPAEAGMPLMRDPRAPKRYGWIYASTGFAVDPSWRPYLQTA